MKFRNGIWLKTLIGAAVLLSLSACSSSDDGGIIGTGVVLRGTTTSNKTFANNTVETRSQTGERTFGTVGNQGQFELAELNGTGPWLVRTNLGNETYLYGIAVQDGGGSAITQNVHSYSDAVARNWFATRGLDIDAEFAREGAIDSMPNSIDLDAIRASISGLVRDVLTAYNLDDVDLSSVNFAANGAGVDQFLQENPVIVVNGNITIIINNPDTDTQSVATEDLTIDTDLTETDNVAPTAPAALRALPSASNEITLVWDVSTDNIGIARYAIARDGMRIATSPFPVYVDIGLTAGTSYTYTVTAIDAAGNESPQSPSATASPLAEIDTTPPPAPENLSIIANTGRMDVTWGQSSVADVASFAIRRGTDATNLPDYVNVSATYLFDSAVDAGQRYCYDVRAVDASGNASAATEIMCATTPGTPVSGVPVSPDPDPTPPPVSSDGLTAPQVDVSSLSCTENVPESSIGTDVVFPAGCYLAPSGITVSEPANLTLDAGVVIKFGAGRTLTVNSGASLTANGTATNPVVLTGREASAGHWSGLSFRFSGSMNNVLDHTQIEYAGNATSDRGAVSLVSTLSSPARVKMTNSTIRRNAGPGLSMDISSTPSMFDGNRITGNAVPVLTHGTQATALDNRTEYTGNTLDAVQVEDSTINQATTWPALAVPYHAGSQSIGDAVWKVDPGATILFNAGAAIDLGGDATLEIVGTAEQPINMSALGGASEGWQGIDMRFSNNNNVIEHTNIQHAGTNNREDSAIGIVSTRSSPSRLTMNNVTISDGQGFAIGANAGTRLLGFAGMTIFNHAGIASLDAEAAQAFNNGGSLTGNITDTIVLKDTSGWGVDVTLSNSDVAYDVGDMFITEGSLTLEEGVTFLMRAGSEIHAGTTGALSADGTAANPIEFIGQERIAGFWDGLLFRFSPSTANRLVNVLVADGGLGGGTGAANVTANCTSSSITRLNIENSRLENSQGFGLFLDQNTGCQVNVDAGTTFTGNTLGDTN